MIAHRARENRRLKALKLSKNIERLYKEGKCRECAVVVTRMDFAKILGKFTKVKIQYESSGTPKTKKNAEVISPKTNAKLKSNENGMVLIHRNAFNPSAYKNTAKEVASPKKPLRTYQTNKAQANNVLKENNRLKKTVMVKDKNSNINITSSNQTGKESNLKLKRYGIIFANPSSKNQNNIRSKASLSDLLPLVNKSILPSEEWCIDYMPRSVEPTDDKVYDRIAAELEDLMYSEKMPTKEVCNSKVDEFPSIMDILNDTNDSSKANDQSTSIGYKANLESSDVEAMLLGKETSPRKDSMEMNTDMTNLIEDVAQFSAVPEETIPKIDTPLPDLENPHSPSILDEALQKGIEEHLPCAQDPLDNGSSANNIKTSVCEVAKKPFPKMTFPSNITHLVFKKTLNEKCVKSVLCPKNLKYSIELEGKTVEFLGAPKFISSLEDLHVLLQIVNETELKNLYVYH